MWVKLKQLIVVLLVLSVQLQPVHVHAVELQTLQSGHSVGQLYHGHGAEDGVHLGYDSSSDDTEYHGHLSECHPGHMLSPVTAGLQPVRKLTQFARWEPLCRLSSVSLAQETPPPRSL
ncbi:hypothetical protein [Amphritea pacifica]|uniref:Secreted protein n=1 Tax=Amphritea pacifica TaxID=2811233 RepID=A0ABS2W3M1_9GAMM|nr:hypothetical protein [Amphritea pacifica]MBN0986309.1 hypothetical protein [Amphritea pacifica]MBN1007000.1 hypothetical protein [Amphritea pacifica]